MLRASATFSGDPRPRNVVSALAESSPKTVGRKPVGFLNGSGTPSRATRLHLRMRRLELLLEAKTRDVVTQTLVERVGIRPPPVARHFDERTPAGREQLLRCIHECSTHTCAASSFGDDQRGESPNCGRTMQHRRHVQRQESNDVARALGDEHRFARVE